MEAVLARAGTVLLENGVLGLVLLFSAGLNWHLLSRDQKWIEQRVRADIDSAEADRKVASVIEAHTAMVRDLVDRVDRLECDKPRPRRRA